MPPPAKKKRKTARGGSGAVGTGTRRTTRSQRPTLSIEMIARVASFANYGNDLMNICLAVGPKDSAVIRHICLRNNMDFLQYTLENFTAKISESDGSRGNTKVIGRSDHCKSNITAWIKVNPDWRKYCTHERTEDDQLSTPKQWNEDGSLLKLRTDPLILFNNPAVAIEFGLVDVLSYLVEVVGIDVNAYKWSGFNRSYWSYAFNRMARGDHLLIGAILESRDDCFECLRYMLSREDIDVNVARRPGEFSKPIWETAVRSVHLSNAAFEAVVRHSSFDPNRPISLTHPRSDPLPLQQVVKKVFFCGNDSDYASKILKRAEILLEVGADPDLQVENTFGHTLITLKSPISRVDNYIRRVRDRGDQEMRAQRLTELAAIMKKHSQGSS